MKPEPLKNKIKDIDSREWVRDIPKGKTIVKVALIQDLESAVEWLKRGLCLAKGQVVLTCRSDSPMKCEICYKIDQAFEDVTNAKP